MHRHYGGGDSRFESWRTSLLQPRIVHLVIVVLLSIPVMSQPTIGQHRASCSVTYSILRPFAQPCAPPLICYNSTCLCPPSTALQRTADFDSSLLLSPSSISHSGAFCVPFSEFRCVDDIQCQDIDMNVVCHINTAQCRCRRGFELNSKGFCSKSYKEKYKMQSFVINILKKQLEQSRSPTPLLAIDPYKAHLFTADESCTSNRDCRGEYVYCHKGLCKCWPEFHFVAIPPSFNRTATTVKGQQKENQRQDNHIEDENNKLTATNDFRSTPSLRSSRIEGACVRRICHHDSECQSAENPNLVCNNTICECRYGYIMFHESKLCMRYVMKRQSCDLTCRIIGGLFATIFMLTLIYWCCYCCYSIVKNYRNYRSQCAANAGAGYAINNRRHNSSETISFSGRLTASVSNFLRAQMVDEPPSYTQAMGDEILPDYDTAVEIQRLNKTDTVDGTEDTQRQDWTSDDEENHRPINSETSGLEDVVVVNHSFAPNLAVNKHL